MFHYVLYVPILWALAPLCTRLLCTQQPIMYPKFWWVHKGRTDVLYYATLY